MKNKKYINTRLFKISALVTINILIFLFLFAIIEIGYRIYHDGFSGAFNSVPYSNLGTSNWVIYDKDLGYRLNPDREKINNLSIKGEEIAIPKPNGLYRIIFLGDSIPWSNPGFVDYTRESLRGKGSFEVINAGVPGYTSYQEVLFFKRYLSQTDPDLVIWTYCLNDNHQFLHRFDENARMLLTEEAKESLQINSYWDKLVSRSYILSLIRFTIISHNKRSNLDNVEYKFIWEKLPDFNIAWKDYSWLGYEENLVELKNLLHKRGGKLVIVIFPHETQVLYGLIKKENYDYIVKPQHKLLSLCKKYAVPCLDLYPSFINEYFQDRRRLFKKDMVHLNKEGHKLATLELSKFLVEKGLLSRN